MAELLRKQRYFESLVYLKHSLMEAGEFRAQFCLIFDLLVPKLTVAVGASKAILAEQ